MRSRRAPRQPQCRVLQARARYQPPGAGVQIESYRFNDAERLRFGKFPALDTVLYRWARGIEEGVYRDLGLQAYVGASVVEEMRFGEFFAALRRPRPIYTLALDPLPGLGLFVLDNRFTRACLNAPAGRPAGRQLRLTPDNQARLQRVVQGLLESFDAAWAGVHEVHAELRKLTTFLFRARLYNAYEPCLVAQLHLSGERLSARLMLCLPRFMLAPVLERVRQTTVIPSLDPHGLPRTVSAERMLGGLRYEVGASLGSIMATLHPDQFRVGNVFPLAGHAGGAVVLDVNGTPLLMGEAGESDGRFAVRVTGPYRPAAPEEHTQPAAFRPIAWPAANPQRRANSGKPALTPDASSLGPLR